jgi:hypothetical protein
MTALIIVIAWLVAAAIVLIFNGLARRGEYRGDDES